MLLLVLACLAVDPKDRFLNEYPAEIKGWRRELTETRGTAVVRSVKGSKLGSPTIFEFATGPNRRKFEFENTVQTAPGKSSVFRYGYVELDDRHIEVERTGPSKPYSVQGIGDDDPKRRSYFNRIFGSYLNSPWEIGGFEIADAVAHGWFAITEAREVEEEGRALVEVTFRLTTMKQPRHYRVTFDPTLHWAITKASKWAADPSKPSERYEATYGPTASGRPYLKTLRYWWGLDAKENLCEFGPVEFASTPTSEFTLEHYGLKSPPLPIKNPNYLIVIAIAMLAVLLLVAAWFTRRLVARQS